MLLRESWKQYGPKVCVLFSDSEFVNGLLKEVVEYLYQVEADDATFAETVRLKLNALHEVVQMWLKART